MTDKTREDFEAWAKSIHLDITPDKSPWGHDIYIHPHADSMWFSWQAATLAEQERCALVWLPIADAPKDAHVLLCIDIVVGHPLVVQGCWFHDDDEDEKGWIDLDGKVLHATHWMPIPPPPAIRQGGAS